MSVSGPDRDEQHGRADARRLGAGRAKHSFVAIAMAGPEVVEDMNAIVWPATSVLLRAKRSSVRSPAAVSLPERATRASIELGGRGGQSLSAALDAICSVPGAVTLQRVADSQGGSHCPRSDAGGAQRDMIERCLE